MARTVYDLSDGTVGQPYQIDPPRDVTSSPVIDSANGAHGGKSIKNTAAGSYQYVEVNCNASTDMGVGYYFYPDAATTADLDDLLLVNGQTSAGASNWVGLRRQGTNRLRLFDAAGTTRWTATNALSNNTLYRAELRYTQATGTLAGAYYLGDSTTAVESFSVAGCTVPPQVDNWRVGKRVTAATQPNTWFSGLQVETNPSRTGGWPLGPTAATAAPTANAGPDQQSIEPYTTVTLDGTSSTAPSGSSITAYAWTQTAGATVTLSDPTAAQPTFTAPALLGGDTLTFSLVVTSTGSVVSAANTMNATVLPHTVFRLETGTTLSPLLLVRL